MSFSSRTSTRTDDASGAAARRGFVSEAILDGQFFMDTQAGRETFTTVRQLGALGEWDWAPGRTPTVGPARLIPLLPPLEREIGQGAADSMSRAHSRLGVECGPSTVGAAHSGRSLAVPASVGPATLGSLARGTVTGQCASAPFKPQGSRRAWLGAPLNTQPRTARRRQLMDTPNSTRRDVPDDVLLLTRDEVALIRRIAAVDAASIGDDIAHAEDAAAWRAGIAAAERHLGLIEAIDNGWIPPDRMEEIAEQIAAERDWIRDEGLPDCIQAQEKWRMRDEGYGFDVDEATESTYARAIDDYWTKLAACNELLSKLNSARGLPGMCP